MHYMKWIYPRRLRNQMILMAILMVIVPTLTIGYIVETEGRSAVLSEKEKIDRTLTEVGEKLPPNLFFRINRRFIIAFDSIREMIRYSGSRIKVVLNPPLAEGEEAFVSTDRAQDFRQWLNR